jgi:hypothetical protein
MGWYRYSPTIWQNGHHHIAGEIPMFYWFKIAWSGKYRLYIDIDIDVRC